MSIAKFIINGIEQAIYALKPGTGKYSMCHDLPNFGGVDQSCVASGDLSVSLGALSTASGIASFAMGTKAADGGGATASGRNSFSFGNGTVASGNLSQAFGMVTKAAGRGSFVCGEYNAEDTSAADNLGKRKYLFIIGNGTADNARSNAMTVDWSGNMELAGSIKIGSTTLTEQQLQALLALL